MRNIDVDAMLIVKAARSMLTWQQYSTIRGQVLSGDAEGAMKGLSKMLGDEWSLNALKRAWKHPG